MTTQAGMEPPQARAYRRSFELGLTRVISQTATKQQLNDGLAELRAQLAELNHDLQPELDRLERWLILFAAAAIGLLITLLVRAFAS